MKGAQQALLMALEFRRDGLGAIAEKIRTALGDEGDAANDGDHRRSPGRCRPS